MKEVYQRMNEKILPAENLQEKVFAKLEKPKRKFHLRPLTAAALMLAVLLLATPAMAAYVPEIADLMYQVSPEIAARFTPIQKYDVKNGIRMEVISASIHGAVTELCVSFEDLEAQRLDENVIMTNSEFRAYGLPKVKYGGSGGGVDLSGFDKETGKLTIMESITHHVYSDDAQRYLTVKENYGDKVTYSVNYLLKQVQMPSVVLPIALTDREVLQLDRGEDGPVRHPFDGFGSQGEKSWTEREFYKVMLPGEAVCAITEELDLMGMAYMDGQLHVQIRTSQTDASHDPGCEVYLRDKNGQKYEATGANSFRIRRGTNKGMYMEWVFDIPEAELGSCTILCDLVQFEYIKGPWRVTFPITESDYVGERDDGIPQVTALETAGHGEWDE